MVVVSIIEKAQVDLVPLLFGALGFVALVVSLQPYTGGIGYRGIAFLRYGKRIWQFSNRLFGGILVAVSMLHYLLFHFLEISADNKVIIATVTCFLSMLISDVITLYLKKRNQ